MELGRVYEAKIIQISKKNTLICQVSTLTGKIREICLTGLTFNAKTKRNFEMNEIIHIQCTSLTPIQYTITKEYIKPLLIFDMHGVLGEREEFQHKKRKFIKRPHCVEFIKLLAQYYELAVWSCGKKKNIDLNIFNGMKLLFIWCQDEATNLYPRTSCVSTEKVVVLSSLIFSSSLPHAVVIVVVVV